MTRKKLWEALARTRTTLQSFGPRRSLVFLLRQVLTRDENVPYAELLQRIRPFHFLVVMRPDGYLASALTGKPLQRMGRMERWLQALHEEQLPGKPRAPDGPTTRRGACTSRVPSEACRKISECRDQCSRSEVRRMVGTIQSSQERR